MARENNIKNFLREYKELCKKYDLSFSFWMGDLELEEYKEDNFYRLEYVCEEYNEKERN